MKRNAVKAFILILVACLLVPSVSAESNAGESSDLNLATQRARHFMEYEIQGSFPDWEDLPLGSGQPYCDLEGRVNSYLFPITFGGRIVGTIRVGSYLYDYCIMEVNNGTMPSIPTSAEVTRILLQDLELGVPTEAVGEPDYLLHLGVVSDYAVYDIGKYSMAINLATGKALPVSDLKMAMATPEQYQEYMKSLASGRDVMLTGGGVGSGETINLDPDLDPDPGEEEYLYLLNMNDDDLYDDYQNNNNCGPTTGAMVVKYHKTKHFYMDLDDWTQSHDGYSPNYDEGLYVLMDCNGHWPIPGTLPEDAGPGLEDYTENCGYSNFDDQVTTTIGDSYGGIRESIQNQQPVMVMFGEDSPGPDLHWNMIKGYERGTDNEDYILTNDPWEIARTLNWGLYSWPDAWDTALVYLWENPGQRVDVFEQGWNMFSFPFDPNPDDWDEQLGDELSQQEMNSIYRYNPSTGGYQLWTGENFDPEIARGYWVRVQNSAKLIHAQGNMAETDPDTDYVIGLQAGWNLIGYPFNFSYDWSNAEVKYDGDTLSILYAAAEGWVSPYLYGYNSETGSYYFAGWRDNTPDPDVVKGQLDPWQGYWIKAYHDCELRLPRVAMTNSGQGSGLRALDSLLWTAQLTVSGNGTLDDANYAMVADDANEEYDFIDAPEPPAPPEPWVKLYFPHGDWTEMPDNYAQDARPNSDNITWGFEVVSSASDNITLSWDVSEIPETFLTVELRDADDNRLVQDMRSTSEYVYEATGDVAVAFKLVVDTREDAERSTTLYTGSNLFAFPLFPDPDPMDSDLQLGDDVTGTELESIARYDTATAQYEYWSDPEEYPADIGRGYWISVSDNKTVDSWGFLAPDEDFTIHLLTYVSNSNLIGHPFDYTVAWGDCMIYNPATQQTVSIATAASNGWISQYIYYYNTTTHGYSMMDASNGELWPWYGYWVTSYISCDLIIPNDPMEESLRGPDSYPSVDLAPANVPRPPPPPSLPAKTLS